METSSNRKVLVVDDDQVLAKLLVMVLDLDGFKAEAVFSGGQSLAWIGRELPAAIFLDIMMPDMDGFTVLRHLRADARTAQLPIIMLSARVDEESRDQSLAAGADAYLTKPATPQQLTDELRAQIAKRASP
jgi:two-component system, OmpR family, phosphate regulon response regulator PhoB